MQTFKKFCLLALAALIVCGSLSSCATVFGGRVTDHQKRKPAPGEQRRPVRVGALIADILLFPLVSIPVDFATGAIYKPKPAATMGQSPSERPVATQTARKK